MKNRPVTERDREIYRLWLSGAAARREARELSQASIARRFGLTRARVGQVIKRLGALSDDAV